MNNVSLIISIVTWNRRKIFERCFNSLGNNTRMSFKILITDNGSSDGTVEYLKSLEKELGDKIDVTYLKENIGIAQARNKHWNKTKGYDVVRLDDDVEILTDRWLEIMKTLSYSNKALIGLVHDTIQHRVIDKPDLFDDGELCGGAYFIPQECVDKLSPWCEEYGLYGHEDLDYSHRARIAGFKLLYTKKIKWNHLVPIAPGRTSPEYLTIYRNNIADYENGSKSL